MYEWSVASGAGDLLAQIEHLLDVAGGDLRAQLGKPGEYERPLSDGVGGVDLASVDGRELEAHADAGGCAVR